MEKLTALSCTDLKKIYGGGPIFEGIAWIFGWLDGYGQRRAASIDKDWNDVDWEKMRTLYE